MLKKILDRIRYKKIQTFTYFIPAPPARKSGYREKSFDQLVEDLVGMGFQILEFTTTATSTNSVQGLWVLFKIQSTNKASYLLKANQFPKEMINESLLSDNHTKPKNEIELKYKSIEEDAEVYQIDT